MSNPNAVYYIGGGKGGTGKSLMSMCLLDYLQHEEKIPANLIETDNSNPDVMRAYAKEVSSIAIDLETGDGWAELITYCEAEKNTIVINSRAGNRTAMNKYSENLVEAFTGIKRPLVTIWVINDERDSVELLAEFIDFVTIGVIHVVKNEMFGTEQTYKFYDDTNIAKLITERGGKVILLPELAKRVNHELRINDWSIARAKAEMPIGNRVELNRWRRIVWDQIREMIRGKQR